MNRNTRGQILIGVIILLVLMAILIPAIIRWLQSDVDWTVKQQKSSTAFNLANGAVERGTWKLKSSTSTWVASALGQVITGYNFDVTYRDLEGGSYRIRFTSGPNSNQVTVTAEARDSQNEETRAVQTVYENQSVPGPILTAGNVDLSGALEPHWGPVMAQGNIALSGAAATNYFPRKFSKSVVTGTVANPRDTNGLTPPNTDNQEWWSGYSVPDLPLLDFTALRTSAAANGTLNYYNGFASSHTYTGYSGSGHTCNVPGSWFFTHANPHNTHFADSNHHPKSKQNLIWYWDGNVNFTGGGNLLGHSNGLYGTVIVRGNMTIETEDNYSYIATVPTGVWREYQRIDTSATGEYPGDLGFHVSSPTFDLGNQTWTGGPAASATDVGFRGFIYVGGNMSIVSGALGDFAGAIWVAGNVTNANASELSLVFYDTSVGSSLPVLNVTLVQQSWREVAPSTTAWP